MFLLILESIGTSELILIGIVALIFLGPRKLPEMARKIGKITAEFRGTASEFKQTWEREVDFEEERKALDLNTIETETIARDDGQNTAVADVPEPPAIKAVDPADYEHLIGAVESTEEPQKEIVDETVNDKRNWL